MEIKQYLILGLMMLGLVSCNKFLDIQPEDRFTENMVFSNEQSIQQALNGTYNRLASYPLYGANLSSTIVELLAQRYNTSLNSNQYVNFQNYGYEQSEVKGVFENTWESAYAAILELNVFIAKMEQSNDVIAPEYARLLIGEAYGLRAMVHFDLLRLFGPVYDSTDSTAIAIPYNRSTGGNYNELLPANIFLDSVQHDLLQAESYLEQDPIRTLGVQDFTLLDGLDFYRNRGKRMNYYAVKLLQSRIHLYRMEHEAANRVAKSILSEVETWFKWQPYTDVVATSQQNPNRIFSDEVFFSLYNMNLYNMRNAYFNSSLLDAFILAPLELRLNNTFEGNHNDFRYTISNTWQYSGNKSYMTFFKYAEPNSPGAKFLYLQPMLRKSELYYILAETEPEETKALEYLNQVRLNRGLTMLTNVLGLEDEIRKEYQKEFFGEGQLFFYYKRKNTATIPSGSSTANVSMTKAKYVVPLPSSETDHR